MDTRRRLVLTSKELHAVKTALYTFVTRNCEGSCEIADPSDVVAIEQMKAEIEAMPVAADVLLKHFKG